MNKNPLNIVVALVSALLASNVAHAQQNASLFMGHAPFLNTYGAATTTSIEDYNTVVEQACIDLRDAITVAKGEGNFSMTGTTSERVEAAASLQKTGGSYSCKYSEQWVIRRDKAIQFYIEKHGVPAATAARMYGSSTGRRVFSEGTEKALEPFGRIVSNLKKRIDDTSVVPLKMEFGFHYEANAAQPVVISYE